MDHFFKGTWGSLGTEDGQFNEPRGIAVDSDGNVHVADSGNNRVQKFSRMGQFLDKWGDEGDGDGQFTKPFHVAVDSNNDIYVSNHPTGLFHGIPPRVRVQKFTPNGDFIRGWGEVGFAAGEFRSPRGIAVEYDDVILVVDQENHRIQKFSSNGESISAILSDTD